MLLAIDTSTRTIGLALYDGVQVLSEWVWTSRDHHTIELAPAVAEMLGQAGLRLKDIQVLAVTIGPGSYTGLRIGLGLAKGIALARHIPLVGIPTLDILAAAQPVSDMTLVAAIQVGRGRLAVGWYQAVDGKWQSKGEELVLPVEALSRRINQPTVVCGEFSADERRILSRKHKNVSMASPARSLRRPSYLGEIAWERWRAGLVDDPATLAPRYLHYKEPIPG